MCAKGEGRRQESSRGPEGKGSRLWQKAPPTPAKLCAQSCISEPARLLPPALDRSPFCRGAWLRSLGVSSPAPAPLRAEGSEGGGGGSPSPGPLLFPHKGRPLHPPSFATKSQCHSLRVRASPLITSQATRDPKSSSRTAKTLDLGLYDLSRVTDRKWTRLRAGTWPGPHRKSLELAPDSSSFPQAGSEVPGRGRPHPAAPPPGAASSNPAGCGLVFAGSGRQQPESQTWGVPSSAGRGGPRSQEVRGCRCGAGAGGSGLGSQPQGPTAGLAGAWPARPRPSPRRRGGLSAVAFSE